MLSLMKIKFKKEGGCRNPTEKELKSARGDKKQQLES